MIKKIMDYIKNEELKIKYMNNNLNIDNYDKILEIKSDVITLSKNNSLIYIRGNNLKLSKLLDNEVLVIGSIKKIEL